MFCLASGGRRSDGMLILTLLRPDTKGNGTGTCKNLNIKLKVIFDHHKMTVQRTEDMPPK
jgi:hypothetical protein